MKSQSKNPKKVYCNHLATILMCLSPFISGLGHAQVKGNKNIQTRSFPVNQIESIAINFYAEVEIDCAAPEALTITTDSNLFGLIEKEMSGTQLTLDQKVWIQPSQKAIIKIGAPGLSKISTGTHDVTKIVNIKNEKFEVISPVGKLSLKGKTSYLQIKNNLAEIDASELISENVKVEITKWGSAKIFVVNEINATLSDDAVLELVNNPLLLTGDAQRLVLEPQESWLSDESIVYIDFKIKNNSGNRHNFVVLGPKPDGGKFSYGFPMMPLATRKERWTTGTEIYKVNSRGLQELLVRISLDDEGKTVKLFQNKN